MLNIVQQMDDGVSAFTEFLWAFFVILTLRKKWLVDRLITDECFPKVLFFYEHIIAEFQRFSTKKAQLLIPVLELSRCGCDLKSDQRYLELLRKQK